LNNIVTLKSRLGVSHRANLCTVSSSLNSTNAGLFFAAGSMGLSSLLHNELQKTLYSVSCCITVVQGRQNWYWSKAYNAASY